jgi:hypothetical protein
MKKAAKLKPKATKKTLKSESSTPTLHVSFKGCTPYLFVRPLPEPPKKRVAPKVRAMTDAGALIQATSFRQDYHHLHLLAIAGDDMALEMLIKNARWLIETLERLAERDPVRFHQWTHSDDRWPSFIGKKKVFGERAARFIKILELSKTSPLSHKWNPNSPATQSAHQMIAWLEDNQHILKLPPLSKSTYEEWFEIGWQGLLNAIKGKPEKDAYLRKFVLGQANTQWKRRGFSRGALGGEDDTEVGLEGVIRDRIRAALKQGMRSIVVNL